MTEANSAAWVSQDGRLRPARYAPSAISAGASLSLDAVSFGRAINPANNSAMASSLPLKLFGDGFEQPQD